MAEPITIGAIVLAGYLFSQDSDKPKQSNVLRSTVAANDVPSSNNRYWEVDGQVRSKATQTFQDAGDPFGTNIIPRDFNTVFPQSQYPGKKIAVVPMDFAESEGVPFSHQNMTPFFGGKLTQNTDPRAGQHQFEASMGGNQAAFYKPKKEQKAIFANVPDRDPRKVEHRDWDHYERSMTGRQDGLKPFQETRVAPGLGKNTDGVTGRDGFHYGNVRAFRAGVDEMRVKGDQQKEEYKQAPARGNAFYNGKRTHEWDEVPKNRPETFYKGFDHERNPGIDGGRSRARPRDNFEESAGCTQRGIGQELPLGPPGAAASYIGIKDDYNIDEHDLRDVRMSGVPSRPLGPQGKLGGVNAYMHREGHGSSVGVRNNKAHDTLVENYAPTPVGNMRRPQRANHLGKVRGRDDNTRMHRMKRANAANGSRYRDTTSKYADCHRVHATSVNAIRNPRMPSADAWETEQHRKNPFTQSLRSVWGE